MKNISLTKLTSIFLVLTILSCVVFTSCAKAENAVSSFTVINKTSSDVSELVDALNAKYLGEKDAKCFEQAGTNVIICVSENGEPFDLSDFNDEGYILRKIDDDIIICGKNETATQMAVDSFTEQYVYGEQLYFANELNYIHGAADRLGKVTLGGVDISEYVVVVPESRDYLWEDYAAKILCDHLFDAGGISLEIIDDSEPERNYEIRIGATNRGSTPEEREYEKTEFYFGVDENDIVMDGIGYMVAGGVGKLIAEYLEPEDCGDVSLDSISDGTVYEFEPREAKNAILMIGDGMGFNHVKLAMSESHITEFYAEQLPVLGEMKTYSADSDVTDSAAAATALGSGFKTNNSVLGKDVAGNDIKNIRELAYESGARTAVLSTDTLDGATPSGFLVHASNRYATDEINSWYKKISVDYVRVNQYWELINDTIEALDIIGESGDPFFMMVEEAYIDKYSHGNDVYNTCDRVNLYNETIAYVMSYVVCHNDTVLVITADHETGGLVGRKKSYIFTSYNHTGVNVPIYAIGYGTEEFFANKAVENVQVPAFMAKIFGDNDFGHIS